MYQDEFQSYGPQYWGPGRPPSSGAFTEYEAYGLGVAPVIVTGGIAIGSRIIGGIFGGGTPEDWRDIVHKENDNAGAIMDSCPRVKWFITAMSKATPEIWDALHVAAVNAGYMHLAKSAADQDLWHFPYYVYESTCNPGRSEYTRNAIKIAEQIDAAYQASGIIIPGTIELGVVARDGVDIPPEELQQLRVKAGLPPTPMPGPDEVTVVNGAPPGPQLAGMLAGMGPMLPWILGAGALLFLLPRKGRR